LYVIINIINFIIIDVETSVVFMLRIILTLLIICYNCINTHNNSIGSENASGIDVFIQI